MMDRKNINCPSCGASHDLSNPGVMMFLCEYCSTPIYWDKERLAAAGQQSVLPEGFSRLYTGATGSLRQKRFVVLGRARYSFGNGYWDEWYLEMSNGQMMWLSEDNHEFSLQKKHELTVGAFENYAPGSTLKSGKTTFIIQEIGNAKCIGIEGELPKLIEIDEVYPYIDASSLDGRYILSIEYDDEPPTVFIGRWLNYSHLSLDDEGGDW